MGLAARCKRKKNLADVRYFILSYQFHPFWIMVEKIHMCSKDSAKLKEIIKIISKYYHNAFSFSIFTLVEIEML